MLVNEIRRPEWVKDQDGLSEANEWAGMDLN